MTLPFITTLTFIITLTFIKTLTFIMTPTFIKTLTIIMTLTLIMTLTFIMTLTVWGLTLPSSSPCVRILLAQTSGRNHLLAVTFTVAVRPTVTLL